MAATSVTNKEPPSLFKRDLPSQCTGFSSVTGRKYFEQAMKEGHLEAYYGISQQLITQNDPSYCGLATLTVALNTLGVDPSRNWKGAWRWYGEEMLDCCRPLEQVRKNGITIAEFVCLARCNGLNAKQTGGKNGFPQHKSDGVLLFRHTVKRICSGTNSTLAISYSRKTLGQTGSGHFSPIGAFDEEDDQVLILDVARFKYPFYWVPLELLYESMLEQDPLTEQPRGYVELSLPVFQNATPDLMRLNLHKSSWNWFLTNFDQKLKEAPDILDSPAIDLNRFIKLVRHSLSGNPLNSRLRKRADASNQEITESSKKAGLTDNDRLAAEAKAITSEFDAPFVVFALAIARLRNVSNHLDPQPNLEESKLVAREVDSVCLQLRELTRCCSEEKTGLCK